MQQVELLGKYDSVYREFESFDYVYIIYHSTCVYSRKSFV